MLNLRTVLLLLPEISYIRLLGPSPKSTIGMSRFVQTACILLLLTSANGRAFGTIVLNLRVIDVSSAVFDYGAQLIYNGAISATATGGIAPYSFAMALPSGGAIQQSNGYFPVLDAGTYTITVTDATGQTTTAKVTVVYKFPQPSVTVSDIVIPSGCISADGGFILTGVGGMPPYTYSIDGGTVFVAKNSFTSLTQGNYVVLIKDANNQIGMIGTNPASKYLPGFIGLFGTTCAITGQAQFSASSCTDQGSMHASVFSDRSQISFSLDGVHYRQLVLNPIIPELYQYDSSGLSPGLYNFYLKNDFGNLSVYDYVIAKFCTIPITFAGTNASCGQNDGSLTVIATDGVPPYTYTMDGINYQSNNQFTGLSPGNYAVTVKDAAGLTNSSTGAVSKSGNCPMVGAVATGADCGKKNGAITATGSNGTMPYQFSLDGVNFQSGNLFTGLASGDYTLTLKDFSGFTAKASVTVTSNCLTVTLGTTNSLCGKPNGSMTVSVASGTPPYSYSIDGINFQNINSFTNLSQGNYTVTVKDITGSSGTAVAVIENTGGPRIFAIPSMASCSNNDGGITLSAIGGTSPFQYSLDGTAYQTGSTFTELASGNYTPTVKDANGCTAVQPVTVARDNTISVDAGKELTICEGTSASLEATSNGTSFSWTPALSLDNASVLDPKASPDTTTIYWLTASLGSCMLTKTVTIIVNPAPVADAGPGAAVCQGMSAQLHGSGGQTYRWSPVQYLDNPGIANPVVTGPAESIT